VKRQSASAELPPAKQSATLVCLLLAVCVVAAKLALVSGNEVVSEHSDALSYLMAAAGNPLTAIGTNPGYPLWLWLAQALGLAQRTAIELLFAAGCIVLSTALRSYGLGLAGYALVLSVGLLSPASYFLFDRVLSDGFYLCLSFMALGFSLMLLRAGRASEGWYAALALGIALGMMALTRMEVPLLAAALLSMALLAAAHSIWVYGSSPARALALALARAGGAGLVAAALVSGFALIHWWSAGVWTNSLAELPSHSRFLSRLAAIETGSVQQRYFPISREARMLAYAHSPALDRLRGTLEAPDNPYMKESERVLNMPGEIGAGWIWHVFNDAAARQGITKPAELDALYSRINDELDLAFASGKLRRRHVLHPLLGGDAGAWLPYLGEGLANVLVVSTHAMIPQVDAAFEPDLFDRICLRRAALLQKQEGWVKGWAYSAGDGVVAVRILAGEAHQDPAAGPSVLAARYARPDVQRGFREQGQDVPLLTGFSARVALPADAPLRLMFALASGQAVVTDELRSDRPQTLPAGQGGSPLIFAVDELPSPALASDSRSELLRDGIRIYRNPWTWAAVLCLALAGSARLGWRALHGDAGARAWLLGAALILSWIVCRTLFFALIDAAAWGAEPRYVAVSGVLLGVLATAVGCAALARQR